MTYVKQSAQFLAHGKPSKNGLKDVPQNLYIEVIPAQTQNRSIPYSLFHCHQLLPQHVPVFLESPRVINTVCQAPGARSSPTDI